MTTEDELRQRIRELEAQLAKKNKQIELWEIAAQRWVTQIDELTRKMFAYDGKLFKVPLMEIPRVHRPY